MLTTIDAAGDDPAPHVRRMHDNGAVLISDVEVGGRVVDVHVADGVVHEVRTERLTSRAPAIDGRGGALLPGLHDHHVHLMATAAALRSVQAGPPGVTDRSRLAAALAGAPTNDGWVRAIGYDESVAGVLDRHGLDSVRADVPVRVQHRSGALWMVNSAGVEALQLDGAQAAGVERTGDGVPTGRLWRMDGWLRSALGTTGAPDLRAIGSALSRFGITGVTDATPTMDASTARSLAAAHRDGALPQHITLLAADLAAVPPPLTLGPAKIVVADHDLPSIDALEQQLLAARAQGRAVAVHCVTRESLLLTLVTLQQVGCVPGDRIEHAAVAPPEAIAMAADLQVTVVTQPSLIALRGVDYLRRVDAADVDHLWPWASLRAGGVRVAGSSDAPYGDLDPWRGMRAATQRLTASGQVMGARERVDPMTAVDGWLSPGDDPGGPARRVEPGAPADLVLLDCPLDVALTDLSHRHVRMTMIAGSIVYDAGASTS